MGNRCVWVWVMVGDNRLLIPNNPECWLDMRTENKPIDGWLELPEDKNCPFCDKKIEVKNG